VLLVVDEVQNLSLGAMEELRMLSNITVDGKASLQTILLGQPQFRPILASKDMEQLRQRVLASYHLGPLTEAETRQYIEHRLRTVDWNSDPAWDEGAFAAVHRHTGGIPRRINTLCSRVLLFGALEEAHTISEEMVDATAEELNRDLGAGLEPLASGNGQYGGLSPDPHEELLRRIEVLERHATRQNQVFRRMLDLLEANAAGRP
jgi:Holliday junction resolvasome RuvABC ATP-dependent DNA helicase subunit